MLIDPRENPTRSHSTAKAHQVSTARAALQIDVPGRTVRRWCQRFALGQLVAGRRVLGPDDVQLLRKVRDQAAALA